MPSPSTPTGWRSAARRCSSRSRSRAIPTPARCYFSIAQDGSLIYVAGSAFEGLRRPIWVDRSGATESIDLTPDVYNDRSISPDGRRVALLVGPIGHGDIWIYDFTQTTFTRLTSDGNSATPTWSADGLWLYYVSLDTPTPGDMRAPGAASGPVYRMSMTAPVAAPRTAAETPSA